MTTLDTLTAPAAADDTVAHPKWCDLTRCTVLDDLPLDGGVHRSRTVRLDAVLSPFGLFDVVVGLEQAASHQEEVYLAVVIPATDAHALFPVGAAAVAAGTVVELLGLARDPRSTDEGITFTHPDVLDIGVREGWADPETDPTRIDWPARQAAAAIPFKVVDGRPVNPVESTPIRWGRGELGHWGEGLAADAVVTATDATGARWLLMVLRRDGHGWGFPGGGVDPGEDPGAAAVRELGEETGLVLPDAVWQVMSPAYVPDPRGTDESWMVTVASRTHLDVDELPEVVGADAERAAWIPADSFDVLLHHIVEHEGGQIFDAHRDLLAGLFGAVPAVIR